MYNLLVAVLSICLVAVIAEVSHARWCDYCQLRDVRKSWIECVRSTSAGLAISAAESVRLADREFAKRNESRSKRLPTHLIGTPAREILKREGVLV